MYSQNTIAHNICSASSDTDHDNLGYTVGCVFFESSSGGTPEWEITLLQLVCLSTSQLSMMTYKWLVEWKWTLTLAWPGGVSSLWHHQTCPGIYSRSIFSIFIGACYSQRIYTTALAKPLVARHNNADTMVRATTIVLFFLSSSDSYHFVVS